MSHVSLKKRHLAERLADQLSEAIGRQGWPAGRKLPPVRDLARQFEVSPNTAHSAVQLLADRGIVELQSRQGAFIQGERSSAARNQIGVIWPCKPDPGFVISPDDWMGRIVRSAELELHEAGYYTTILGYIETAQFHERLEPMRPLLAGVLTFSMHSVGSLLDLLDQCDIPWITINPLSRLSVHNFVTADNQGDCARLGRAMAEAGLRRVWILTSPVPPASSTMAKVAGFHEGFIEAGVSLRDVEIVTCENWLEPAGYNAMRRRLDEAPPPQAVFAPGDLLALGALRACREKGVRVPEEVGVIGGTGLNLAELSHPSLSVVPQPMEEMGRHAGQMLVEMARGGIRRMIGRRIAGQFIQRESFVLPDNQNVQPPSDVPAAEISAGSASRTS